MSLDFQFNPSWIECSFRGFADFGILSLFPAYSRLVWQFWFGLDLSVCWLIASR